MPNKISLSLQNNKWSIICLLLVVGIYVSTVIIYAENIPDTDDIAVLSSIYEILDKKNWLSKFNSLFSFHNEHRIVSTRLIALFFYFTSNKTINIIEWIFFGNSLLFIIIFLLLNTKNYSKNILFILPVFLFILQPMHYELMYWGMAAVQNFTVLFVSILAFYFIVHSKNYAVVFFLSLIAIFSSANGLFTFLISSLLFLYKREYGKSGLWAISGIILGYLYWKGFPQTSSKDPLQLINCISTFVYFTGGIVYTQSMPFLSFLLGTLLLAAIILSGYLFFIKEKNSQEASQLFFFSCLLFLLLTIAAISLGRSPSNTLSSSRYKIYPALTISLTYLLWFDYIKNHIILFKIILGTSFLFWLISYAHCFNRFERHSQLVFSHFFNWKHSNILDVHSQVAENYYSYCWNKFYLSGQYIPPNYIVEKSRELLNHLKNPKKIKASLVVSNGVVNVLPITLPVGEYYLVNESTPKIAIYPLNAMSRYVVPYPFSQRNKNYSAFINTTYWPNPSRLPYVVSTN